MAESRILSERPIDVLVSTDASFHCSRLSMAGPKDRYLELSHRMVSFDRTSDRDEVSFVDTFGS